MTRLSPFSARRSRRLLGALAVSLAVALTAPAVAEAHAFLIASSPQPGARLAQSPAVMTLTFSEPFVAGSARVTIRRGNGESVKLPPPIGRGALVRQPLPRDLRGVFVVSWRVLADDGHLSAGEFAFAVGSAGRLPAVAAGTRSRTPPGLVVFSMLVFAGLALALGGLAGERAVWRRLAVETPRLPLLGGVALAAVGVAGQLTFIAGERAGGGFATGLNAARLADAAGNRPGLLTIIMFACLVAATPLLSARRLRVLAAVPLLVVIVSVSLRGHAGSSGHAWAVAADALHLAAAVLWVGALTQLVLVVASRRLRGAGELATAGVRRYAALALPTVLVLLATGAVNALAELRSPSELLTTGYGRTLLVKGALVALALTLALSSRLLALPANPGTRLGLLRRLTRGEAGALLAVLVAVAVLVNSPPPRSAARPAGPALGPPPLSGPTLQVADLAGLATVVGVEASQEELRFRVLRADDPAPRGTRLKVEALGPGRPADLYPRPCGPGCFQIQYRLRPGLTRLDATVSIPKWPLGVARVRIPWPPRRAAPGVLPRVLRSMRSVPRLELKEHVTSGPGATAGTTTSVETGRSFMATEPYGAVGVDVRPLDSHRPHRRFAFALPGSNIWVRITIDGRYRLRRETIVSPGHLIERSFAYPRA